MNTRWWYLMQDLPIHETLSSMDSQCHTRPTDSCNARVLRTMEGLPKSVYMLSFVNPDGLSRDEHHVMRWTSWLKLALGRGLSRSCTGCSVSKPTRVPPTCDRWHGPRIRLRTRFPSSRILWRSACLVLGDLDRLTTGVTLHPATEHLVGIILSFCESKHYNNILLVLL